MGVSQEVQAEANLRSQGRANVFLSAAIVVGASSVPVRVRNLSTRGAFVDGNSLPSAGASFRLVRGQLSADGEVAWAAHGHAGPLCPAKTGALSLRHRCRA